MDEPRKSSFLLGALLELVLCSSPVCYCYSSTTESRGRMLTSLLCALMFLTASTAAQQGAPSSNAPVHTVTVVKKIPHDTSAFTQGLEYENHMFYESTGLYGKSSLRRVRACNGKVLQMRKIYDKRIFGEGMTLFGKNRIFMLSWKSGKGFIFDRNSFGLLNTWRYRGEGWGLTMHDSAKEIWMSNGTDTLRVLDPWRMKTKRQLKVTLNGEPLVRLNEIEWVCGELWANVWLTKNIVRIDPKTGKVKGVIDCSNLPLKKDVTPNDNTLNGIAFDWRTGRLWFTGKQWAKVYQVKVNGLKMDLTKCGP